ncbi:hypothetical protein C9I99_04945 [Photobacterium lutimaris]|uniref:Lipoprotein n=2 Tax=Photobacterium lutimaris TaxID=388278 RepID=A0A2T3J4Y8_9GAMM|nr:hypothetical protein C9I99_04945 [Photobacterium lutimaris]TDR74762.1 hypothetical protein DFP78_10693 [Photobacterium lutimaris]
MKIRLISIVSALFLSGCSLFVSESYFGDSWTGHHIDELVKQWGEPNQMKSEEGGVIEVEYKIFSDSCTYIFITDEQGIISSYKYESTFLGTCKPIG